MILHRPADADVDVEFTFAQVGIEEAAVDWGSNCGNCSAVVGLYAIEKGWVIPNGDVTRIVTRNTNTGQIIIQRVADSGRRPADRPAGPDARRTVPRLPGRARLPGPGRQDHRQSCCPPDRADRHDHSPAEPAGLFHMVDAGAPVVMLRAEDLGLDPERYDSWAAGLELQLDTLEHIRRQAAVRMGLAPTLAEAARAVPKVAIVAAPAQSDAGLRRRRRDALDGQAAPGPGHHRQHRPDPRRPHPGHRARQHHRRLAAAHAAATHSRPGVIETWSEERYGTLLVGVDRTARTIATTIIHLPEALGSAVEASLASATQ